jgi:2-succinyl-5-enolpyruvyl-6-hydroxy-3-cyclohexene-1-carboxylate synthase
VAEDGVIRDTSMNLYGLIEGHPADVLKDLIETVGIKTIKSTQAFTSLWEKALEKIDNHAEAYELEYSQMAAVKYFEGAMMYAEDDYIHYGNSTAVRLANIYANHYVYCNRGVNGIEGSLSTAAGFSCVVDENVYCVIGDLSFFYDQNALWNQNLRGNLRILLLNNGKGGIFNMLKGLEVSPARDRFVAAEHKTSAEGICRQNDVVYLRAGNTEEMQEEIDRLIDTDSDRPVLLEVFTDAEIDEKVLKDYFMSIALS